MRVGAVTHRGYGELVLQRYGRLWGWFGAGDLTLTNLVTLVGEFVSIRTSYSVLLGLAIHALFDGVAIGSGFALSSALGWLIFLAILLHKAPEGFTMASIMLASGASRATALFSATILAGATLVGVLVIGLAPGLVRFGLPISAGVALYVAATDLVPEVNREPGIRMALVFFAGVAGFLALRLLLPAV